MTGKESALAVLLESVEVRQVFSQWPTGMNLAICLLDNGECRMFIFRHEEAGGFPARMRQYLNLPASDISLFPAVAGYPSRKLLYSDEQRLLALVADAPELVEEAIDYSANYLFALEEGLDPAAFLRRSVVAAPGRAVTPVASGRAPAKPNQTDVEPTRKPAGRAKPVTVSKKPGGSGLPAFLRETDIVQPGPHFRSASEISAAEEPPGLCRLGPERNGWIVVERSGTRGGDVRVTNPGSIFLRDDRQVIALRLEPAWPERGPLPMRILIRAANLPPSLRTVLAENVGEARLESDGNFLFLRLPMPRPAAKPDPVVTTMPEPESRPPEPEAAKAPARWRRRRLAGRRRMWLVAGIASLLMMIGIGMRFGAPPTRPDEPNASIDWNRYRVGSQPGQSG